ncbi:MAG TPA: ArsR family transcriptional regulator [Firmicutes bacterium]|nr:ArsR family transcriptional regulator [Bacillota bacterium]
MESRDSQLAELSRRLSELQAEVERLKQSRNLQAGETGAGAVVQQEVTSVDGNPARTRNGAPDTALPQQTSGFYKGAVHEAFNAIDAEFLSRLNDSPIQAIAIGRFMLPNGKSLPWQTSFSVRDHTGNPGAGVEAISEEQVASTLEPFVNPRRIKILKELFKGPLSSSELTLHTGLVGGQLYHHLTVLEEARMIARDRERYVLTYSGAKLLFLSAMAAYDTWNSIRVVPDERLPYD